MGQNIECPKCKEIVLHNVRGSMVVSVKCQGCGKLIVYNPVTDEVKRTKIPSRQTSSGLRIY